MKWTVPSPPADPKPGTFWSHKDFPGGGYEVVGVAQERDGPGYRVAVVYKSGAGRLWLCAHARFVEEFYEAERTPDADEEGVRRVAGARSDVPRVHYTADEMKRAAEDARRDGQPGWMAAGVRVRILKSPVPGLAYTLGEVVDPVHKQAGFAVVRSCCGNWYMVPWSDLEKAE